MYFFLFILYAVPYNNYTTIDKKESGVSGAGLPAGLVKVSSLNQSVPQHFHLENGAPISRTSSET